MNISVVVSTYTEKRLNDILVCFDSLNKQSIKPYEIILVLDPSPDLIRFYKSKVASEVKVVVSPEKGLSNARNTGISNSKGDIVAFIDDDAYADEHWLENLAKNYEDPEVMGVGGTIRPLFDDSCPPWFPQEFHWIVGCSYQEQKEKRLVRNPIGCNMSFRKHVFDRVGYFRSDVGRYGKMLLAGEEAEFSLRLYYGFPNSKIICDPSAIVYHRVPKSRQSIKYSLTRAYYEGVSKGIIAKMDHSTNQVLSTEQGYLKHLLLVFIPSRLKKIYTWKGVSQLVTSVIFMSAVFFGYVHARVTYNKDVTKINSESINMM